MKSKLMLLTLALASVSMTMSAQSTKEKYTSDGDRNIFISVTGGISTINSGPKEGDFGNIAPHITLSLGKWFNPVVGMRLQAGAWKANYDTKYSYGNLVNGVEQPNPVKYSKNVFILRGDFLYNLSNAIFGYNPNRVFTLSAFAGPGLTFAKSVNAIKVLDYQKNTYERKDAGNKIKAMINGSVGLLANFNVSDYVSIDIEARGELASSYLSYNSIARQVGGIYVGAGLTYTFGGRSFVPRQAKVDNSALNDEINRLRQELAQALSDLNKCREDLANRKPETVEVTKEVEVAAPRAIFFTLGSSKLDDYGKVNIKLAAEAMKANPNHKYKVSGYADSATGTSSWNKTLTDRRAQVVYDALIAEGVSSSQLEMVSNGGTDNMFGQNKLQRMVLIED